MLFGLVDIKSLGLKLDHNCMETMSMMKRAPIEYLTHQYMLIFIILFVWTGGLLVPVSAYAVEKPAELKIPAAVNPGLQHLLDLADPDKKVTFDPQMVATVLDFVESPKKNEALYYSNVIRGLTSAYYDFDIHQNLKTMVDYAFNPDIPGIATMPSSMRLFQWIDSGGNEQAHPRLEQYLGKINSPVMFRGRQYVENTPDLNSGAYYGYNLHQILLTWHSVSLNH